MHDSTTKLLEERYQRVLESLEPEKAMFDDPEGETELEIDDEDPNNAVLHYMGYEFPVSKVYKAGVIQYMVGGVTNGRIYSAKSVDQFSKVLAALDRGEVKPAAFAKAGGMTSSPMSKVQRVQPGEMVPVYYINPKDPRGEYIEKMREYMTNPQAEKYILDMYRKHGQKIFLTGQEGKAYNPLNGYATDNANHKDKYSQYWDLTRWMSKMNLADYRGGHKGPNIIGRRSKE
jgi:hypothetical protein